jgi:hypothetical protein
VDRLDLLIRNTLIDFVEFVQRTGWYGREHEAVSLYTFGFLAPKCDPNSLFRDPTQIGIDVAVRQLSGPRRKALVCNDLIIWPEPGGTCWDRPGHPLRDSGGPGGRRIRFAERVGHLAGTAHLGSEVDCQREFAVRGVWLGGGRNLPALVGKG